MAFKASYANERLLRFSHAQSLKFICGSTRKSLKLDLYGHQQISDKVFEFIFANLRSKWVCFVDMHLKKKPCLDKLIFISNVGGILKLAMTREHRSIIEGSVVTLR
jgi:hypothetical protein